MGDLRSNQLIGTFGPGAIYDLVDYSVVILSADLWLHSNFQEELLIQDLEILEVVKKRMQTLTDFKVPSVRGLMLPPYDSTDKSNAEHGLALGNVEAYRFPLFHRCSRCMVLCKLSNTSDQTRCSHEFSKNNQIPCDKLEKWKRGRLEPVRFITKCTDGHLQDFNWVAYKKLSCASDCQNHEDFGNLRSPYYLNETSQGDSFRSMRIECRSCKKNITLAKIPSVLRDLRDNQAEGIHADLRQLFHCNGARPWLPNGDSTHETCSRLIDFIPRGQSDVYIPVRDSYISIPKDDFQKYDLPHDQYIEYIFEDLEEDEDPKDGLKPFKKSYKTPIYDAFALQEDNLSDEKKEEMLASYFYELIKWKNAKDAEDTAGIEHKYKLQEYDSLNSSKTSEDFICQPILLGDSNFISGTFNSISKVEKLKIINVLMGFQRSFDSDNSNPAKFHPSITKPHFLPSNISWGEGIFFEFNFNKITSWLNANETFASSRDELLRNRSLNSLQNTDIKNTTYSLVHSFSHMLMKQLAFESGFSVSELTEKIYFIEEEKKIALLIHTTSGDSQCSMGGLSDLADSNKLEGIIKRGLNQNLSCSNDPLCIDSEGQGTSSLSHAACFGCLMLPEICCEIRPIKNSYLDRNLLIDIDQENIQSFFK